MMKDIENFVHKTVLDKLDGLTDFDNEDILQNIGMDSMKIIEVVLLLEEKYGFEFEPDKLSYETLRTVSSISKYIYQRTKGNV